MLSSVSKNSLGPPLSGTAAGHLLSAKPRLLCESRTDGETEAREAIQQSWVHTQAPELSLLPEIRWGRFGHTSGRCEVQRCGSRQQEAVGVHKGFLEAQICMCSYMCVGLAGGGKRRGMKEAGGGAGQDMTGPGERGSAGQDREARSPARYGGPQWVASMCISRSAQLFAMVFRCVLSSLPLCTFVQQTYVEKLSYILSLHGPGHRDRVSCPGSYYKILLEKKARCRMLALGVSLGLLWLN